MRRGAYSNNGGCAGPTTPTIWRRLDSLPFAKGVSPFSDDTSTPRETAFAKIRARFLGTELAAEEQP